MEVIFISINLLSLYELKSLSRRLTFHSSEKAWNVTGKGRRSKSKGLAIFQMQCIFLLFFSTRNFREPSHILILYAKQQ
jgi:hypothetical protein